MQRRQFIAGAASAAAGMGMTEIGSAAGLTQLGSLKKSPRMPVLFVGHALETGDVQALQEFQKLGAAAQLAHPTHDHYLPLLYAAGAVDATEEPRFFNTSYQAASISMRSAVWG